MKDYFKYQNKVCVVTGAASGMGEQTAKLLVEMGATVYALDWNPVNIEGITEYIAVNLGDKTSIDQAFSKIPDHIDCFFGIAGVSGIKTDFNTTVTIDFIANKYISENYLLQRMTEGDSICFVTSTGGNHWEREGNKKSYMPLMNLSNWEELTNTLENMQLNSLPGPLGYMYAKMAMNYYTAYLVNLFGTKKVRVNSLLPGSTETGMKEEFSTAAGGDEKLLAETGFSGRLATSIEMAEPIVFLNSNMARFISGELLIVDYGCSLMRQAQIKEDPNGQMTFDQIVEHMKK